MAETATLQRSPWAIQTRGFDLRVVLMDPADERAKDSLTTDLGDGWSIGGIFKPSIFSRKIVVYLQRKKSP